MFGAKFLPKEILFGSSVLCDGRPSDSSLMVTLLSSHSRFEPVTLRNGFGYIKHFYCCDNLLERGVCTRVAATASLGEHHRMKKLIVSVLALGFVASTGLFAQNTSSTTSST